MTPLVQFCPDAPDWSVAWDACHEAFSWVRDLAACDQDPRWHAEGNVWIHTRMACEELAKLTAFRELPHADRVVCFAAVLMHDVAKPVCTRVQADGSITSKGHSGRGDNMVRRILWQMNVSMDVREQVAGLVRYHQLPFYVVDHDDAARKVHTISQVARCDLLALVAEADARGRRCENPTDQARMLENTALFVELCREQACLRGPRAFASDHSRFLYFRKPERDPAYAAHDDTRCAVTIMSGLPGAGKNTWLARSMPALPVVSLDAIRVELGVSPTDPQGRVVALAREQAREHLRARRDFAWNATNLSRDHRAQLITLMADYNARVNFVYVEAAARELWRRNREREVRVPEPAMHRMLDRWTVPDATEAHEILHVVHDGDV